LHGCVRLYVYSDGFYTVERLKGLEPVFSLVVCRDYVGFDGEGLVAYEVDVDSLRGCVEEIRRYVVDKKAATHRRGSGGEVPHPVPSLGKSEVDELLGLRHPSFNACRKLGNKGIDALLLAMTIALSAHRLSEDRLLVDALLDRLGG